MVLCHLYIVLQHVTKQFKYMCNLKNLNEKVIVNVTNIFPPKRYV
jgi:hypothetical protein